MYSYKFFNGPLKGRTLLLEDAPQQFEVATDAGIGYYELSGKMQAHYVYMWKGLRNN